MPGGGSVWFAAFGTPPRMLRDLGAFVNPFGMATRQWIIAGLDTVASLRWLTGEADAAGWCPGSSQQMSREGVVLELRATHYPSGIGFDGVHNLRLTVADAAVGAPDVSGPQRRRCRAPRRC